MRTRFQMRVGLIVAAAVIGIWPGPTLGIADSLTWRANQNQVDAEIESWPLARVLETIASATDWQIYVEPDTDSTVTTRFQKLKTQDALRRLLGELNFALLPQTNGPTRLFVYRNSVRDATQLVRVAKPRPDPAGKPIPNELIVRLKPGAGESIEALAKRLGAKVTGRIDGLNAYRLQFDDAAAAQEARSALQNDENVASVENNVTMAPPGQVQALTMNAPSAPPPFKMAPPNNASDKLLIALVDTAIQSRGAAWADYITGSSSLAGQANLDPNQLTHGTAMMDTLWDAIGKTLKDPGSASLGLLALDVYGNNSTTSMFDVANAVVEAVNKGAKIVNLSLGGTGDSPLLDEVLAQAHAQGVLMVASAGNEHVATPTYPAANQNVLAVTAGTKNGDIAPWANYGNFVSLIAPGASIVYYNGQAYLVTGTSASAASTSGTAVGLALNENKSPLDIAPKISSVPGFKSANKP